MEEKKWNPQTKAMTARTLGRYYQAAVVFTIVAILGMSGILNSIVEQNEDSIAPIVCLGIFLVILLPMILVPSIDRMEKEGMVLLLWGVRILLLTPLYFLLHGVASIPAWYKREYRRIKNVLLLMEYNFAKGLGVFGTKEGNLPEDNRA